MPVRIQGVNCSSFLNKQLISLNFNGDGGARNALRMLGKTEGAHGKRVGLPEANVVKKLCHYHEPKIFKREYSDCGFAVYYFVTGNQDENRQHKGFTKTIAVDHVWALAVGKYDEEQGKIIEPA